MRCWRAMEPQVEVSLPERRWVSYVSARRHCGRGGRSRSVRGCADVAVVPGRRAVRAWREDGGTPRGGPQHLLDYEGARFARRAPTQPSCGRRTIRCWRTAPISAHVQRSRRKHGAVVRTRTEDAPVGLPGAVARRSGRGLADLVLGPGALLRAERPGQRDQRPARGPRQPAADAPHDTPGPPRASGTPGRRRPGRPGMDWWPPDGQILTEDVGNRLACNGCGPCELGCPRRSRSSADVTYWPRHWHTAPRLVTGATVTEVISTVTGAPPVSRGWMRRAWRTSSMPKSWSLRATGSATPACSLTGGGDSRRRTASRTPPVWWAQPHAAPDRPPRPCVSRAGGQLGRQYPRSSCSPRSSTKPTGPGASFGATRCS